MMIGFQPNIFWKVCWAFVTPTILTVRIACFVTQPALGMHVWCFTLEQGMCLRVGLGSWYGGCYAVFHVETEVHRGEATRLEMQSWDSCTIWSTLDHFPLCQSALRTDSRWQPPFPLPATVQALFKGLCIRHLTCPAQQLWGGCNLPHPADRNGYVTGLALHTSRAATASGQAVWLQNPCS